MDIEIGPCGYDNSKTVQGIDEKFRGLPFGGFPGVVNLGAPFYPQGKTCDFTEKEIQKFTKQDDIKFLNWLHDRMIHVYGENEYYDYIHKLHAVISRMEE